MNVKQCELFKVLVRTGSLGRAAAELGTSQPRLTQQLRSIEKELGTTLFYRSALGLKLTEAGSTLLPFAQQIASTFERAQSAVSAVSENARAHLRLGISFTTSMKLASEFLHEFHKRYPRIQVTLAVRTPRELAEGLEGGLFDLCGGLELPETTIFVRKQIFSTRMVGISAASINLPVRITLEELCRTPLVLTSRKCATRLRLDAAFKRAGVKPTVCMEVDEASTINALVKTGTVASILPETLATGVRTVTVHKIRDLDVPVTGYFLYPRNPGKEAENFMATIQERIAPRLH